MNILGRNYKRTRKKIGWASSFLSK